jgi:hypothetical protein
MIISQSLSIHTSAAKWIKHWGVKQNDVAPVAESRNLPLWLRFLLAVALLCVTGFCGVGFLATFEPNPWWVTWPWRLAYTAAGFACLAGIGKLLVGQKTNPPDPQE